MSRTPGAANCTGVTRIGDPVTVVCNHKGSPGFNVLGMNGFPFLITRTSGAVHEQTGDVTWDVVTHKWVFFDVLGDRGGWSACSSFVFIDFTPGSFEKLFFDFINSRDILALMWTVCNCLKMGKLTDAI